MKTIRFGDLVRGAGRPKTVTLWTKPEDDPSLTDAVKKNRVLTLVQETGKKDHGFVGFKLLPGALYLEFPRPLPREEEARVVGIDYKLIDEPTVPEKGRAKPVKPPKPPPAHKKAIEFPSPPAPKKPVEPPPKPVIQKPQPREFTVRVRRTATLEDEITVKALDQNAAEQQALERAKHRPFKPGGAVRAEVVNTKER